MNSFTLSFFFVYLFLVVVYDKFRNEIYRNLMIACLCGFTIFLVVGCKANAQEPRGTYESAIGERINIDQYERGLLIPLWRGYVMSLDDPSQPTHNVKCAAIYKSNIPDWETTYWKYCNINRNPK